MWRRQEIISCHGNDFSTIPLVFLVCSYGLIQSDTQGFPPLTIIVQHTGEIGDLSVKLTFMCCFTILCPCIDKLLVLSWRDSKTPLRIFSIFCTKVGHYIVRKLTQQEFQKYFWFSQKVGKHHYHFRNSFLDISLTIL